MRICMLGANFYATNTVGGLERSGQLLAEKLVERGHEVTLLTRNNDRLQPREVRNGVIIQRFPVRTRSDRGAGLGFVGQCFGWLGRNRASIDVVHAHQCYSPGLAAALGRLIVGLPAISKISSSGQYGEAREIRRLPLSRLRVALLRRLDRLVAVSEPACREFVDLGIPERMITVIPNGVRMPENRPEQEHDDRDLAPLFDGDVHYAFAGRIAEEKGLDVLLEAWPGLLESEPGARLVLIGDGGRFRSVEGWLRRRIEDADFRGTVRWIGRVPDVVPYLMRSDVFVLPSRSEGLSNALLEAMACGLAPLVSDAEGNLQVVRHEREGLVSPRGDREALQRQLVRLARDRTLRSRLGAAARERIRSEYAIEAVVDRYLDLYREVTSR